MRPLAGPFLAVGSRASPAPLFGLSEDFLRRRRLPAFGLRSTSYDKYFGTGMVGPYVNPNLVCTYLLYGESQILVLCTLTY